ncbi:MAG: signal peptidase II [Deltaproteobacteria bacterium]|nr:MAG: signal peptidase II [Deltaproteobacteria bacterium]
MGHRFSLWGLLGLALTLVGCDASTKWMAVHHLKEKAPMEVNSYFDFRYVENHDVAFHLMRWIPTSARFYVILALGILTSLVLITLFILYARRYRWLSVGFVCILSGAFGNISDRIVRGFVVDFIHVHYYHHSFPVFNVADICVSVGIGIVMLAIFHAPHQPALHLTIPPPPLPPHKPYPKPLPTEPR